VLVIARYLARARRIRALRGESGRRAWALDLRFALLALFALCALAEWSGTSIMIAGFAAGLIVAVEGGPERLSDQVSGVANGFLVPLFFVVLGASLNVRALVQTPTSLELAGALIVGMLIVHLFAALVIRAPAWVGLIVTAQLGVPAAVVRLGLTDGVLRAGQGAAIILAALASLGICAAGTAIANAAGPRASVSARGAAAPRARPSETG
jgi:Kef-type K+ transport system membrane component KefB